MEPHADLPGCVDLAIDEVEGYPTLVDPVVVVARGAAGEQVFAHVRKRGRVESVGREWSVVPPVRELPEPSVQGDVHRIGQTTVERPPTCGCAC